MLYMKPPFLSKQGSSKKLHVFCNINFITDTDFVDLHVSYSELIEKICHKFDTNVEYFIIFLNGNPMYILDPIYEKI